MIAFLYCVDKISTLFPSREVKLVIIGTYFMTTFHLISTGKWYASSQFHMLHPYIITTNVLVPQNNLRTKNRSIDIITGRLDW